MSELDNPEYFEKKVTEYGIGYRCKNYNGPIALGAIPPSGLINPDYKQQPSNPRKCVECGKTHDTIVENRMTGERINELDKCYDCFMEEAFTKIEWGGTARCMTSDDRNINIAEELNRLERGMIE